MKTKIHLAFYCSVFGAVLSSCNHMAIIERPVDDAALQTMTINLDSLDLSSQLSKMRNSVSFEDVQKYVSRMSPQTKGGEKDYEIIPQVDEENDTIFYLVQYEKGWKLIASDRRVQPILAENEEGRYEDMMKVDGPRIWTEILAYEMKTVKHLSDEEFKMPREEQEAWKKLWAAYCDIDALLAAFRIPTKGGGIPPSLGGHYVPIDTLYDWVFYDSIPHLTRLGFSQEEPLNQYCPYKSDSNTLHAPAGCSAIAGTILFKFLNEHYGYPVSAPSTATVSSHVGEPLQWLQYNFNTTVWNSMVSFDHYASAAPLVANIANLLGTTFGDEESGANYLNLKNNVFPAYGIDCDHSDYDEDLVVNSLLNGMPVIISAKKVNSITSTHRHTFLIDAYKRYRNVITEVQQWEYDYAGQGYAFPEPDEPIRYIYTYSTPEVAYIQMNWGDGGGDGTSDSIWYTLTGYWVTSMGNSYNFFRKMLYNYENVL